MSAHHNIGIILLQMVTLTTTLLSPQALAREAGEKPRGTSNK